ncbi:FAD-binding oxidoreductase [Microbacter sp. GSS18]|nr:FAD-binding oxidoreductase [Microbacter sp. GSS18]
MSITVQSPVEGAVTITDDELAGLRMRFRGAIVSPADDGYDDVRAVENLAVDRRPGLIIRCSGVADVIDGVNLARERGFTLAIRAGGHHIAGHGTTEGGLVIDLRDMDGVWVNPADKTVRVQGGATWGQVDRETQVHGLAVPGGIVSTTGVAGLTLGGGIGWLHRAYGLACDNLLSARVVLASGEVVTASDDENPDLFWAIRGGGGNFGVVVDFTFRAHPVGPEVALAAVFYEADAGRELMPQWRDLALRAGDRVTTRAMHWSMPAVDFLPPPVQGKDVFLFGAVYAGDKAEGQQIIDEFRSLGEPLFDMSEFLPDYRTFQAGFDPLAKNLYGYWKSVYVDELSDEVLAFIDEIGMSRPDPRTLVHVPIMGGATAAVPADATAFGERDGGFMLSIDGATSDPEEFDRVKTWVREAYAAACALPGAHGAYLNFSADDASATEVVRRQFGGNLDRLRAVKRAYDPANLFHVNGNITPA